MHHVLQCIHIVVFHLKGEYAMQEEKQEQKPRSFRIDDSTMETFKEVAKEIGGNQQTVLSKLIEVYQFQKGKTVMGSKGADIEKFEQYITIITKMYMNSIQENANMSDTIYGQFEAQLLSKDETIIDLQKQLKEALASKKESDVELVHSEEKILKIQEHSSTLESELNDLRETHAQSVKDKDQVISALKDNVETLTASSKKISDDYAAAMKELSELRVERDNLLKHGAELEKENESLHSENELLTGKVTELTEQVSTAVAAALKEGEDKIIALKNKLEYDFQKELLNNNIEHANTVNGLKEKHQQEIDVYQKKYFELFQSSKGALVHEESAPEQMT